jgi:aspartate-semialdehyde dehydrogenase
MSKRYKVGIVGTGAVGAELVKVIRERNFPISELRIIARSERDEIIAGEKFHVYKASPEQFEGLDIALFAGTEGEKGASRTYGWEAVSRGVIVIDNGDDFRMDPRVPLVIPEINAYALEKHQGFISNPNCSTIIALMAIAPLDRVARVKRMVVSTYQSVSGTGAPAIRELERQLKQYVSGEKLTIEVYPHQIAMNLFPHIGSLKPELPGYTSEEAKMLFETRKILNRADIQVSATCVRVPVFYGHSISINAEFEQKLTPQEAREILSKAPGVKVADDISSNVYPMPLLVEGKDEVLVGRIREDFTVSNGLVLFVAGDNIRKGAALNAVQIAEELIRRNLLRISSQETF